MYTYDTELGWGDLLVGYDGNTITHDGVGNPLSDGTWTYTWKHGRQLESMSDSDVTWTYQYNADGLRTYRYSDDASYYYSYIGDKLWHYTKDYTSFTITYDAMGMPYSLDKDGVTYYYILNLQGDVVAIDDDEGNMVVYYVYDAWGNLISMTDTSGCGIGTDNVLRYRGYVYDQETGLYYLQSRYYNPQLGRFLNADAFVSTGQGILGNNMFMYCLNNPVIYGDYAGYDAVLLLDKDTVGHIGIMAQDKEGTWWHFYWGTSSFWRRVLCAFAIPVKPTTWCVKYTGDISLESINNSSQYSGDYEKYISLSGDFSSCISEMKNPTGKYNLYTANCSQISLGILAKAETSYSSSLSKATKQTLPTAAFLSVEIDMLIKKINNQIENIAKGFEYAFKNLLRGVA